MVIKMKPKRGYVSSPGNPAPMDLCQTPPYAVAPLLPFIRRKEDEYWKDYAGDYTKIKIWEPACGQGILANALRVAGFTVIETDLALGQDFFEYQPEEWDILITNPPYGVEVKYPWIERCYELGKPFALLMSDETVSAARAIPRFKRHSLEMLIPYPRVNFKMPDSGWFSSAQFPTAWFCESLLPEQLIFREIHPVQRSEVRWVSREDKKTGKVRVIRQTGYPDWIERPSEFNWQTEQFVYYTVRA